MANRLMDNCNLPTAKTSQIMQQFEDLEKVRIAIAETVTILEERLRPILGMSPPCAETGQSLPTHQMCGLAENLAAKTANFQSSLQMLRNILDRCEL